MGRAVDKLSLPCSCLLALSTGEGGCMFFLCRYGNIEYSGALLWSVESRVLSPAVNCHVKPYYTVSVLERYSKRFDLRWNQIFRNGTHKASSSPHTSYPIISFHRRTNTTAGAVEVTSIIV